MLEFVQTLFFIFFLFSPPCPRFSRLHSQQSQYRNKSGGIEEHSLMKPNLVCEGTQGACKAKRLGVKLISRYTLLDANIIDSWKNLINSASKSA